MTKPSVYKKLAGLLATLMLLISKPSFGETLLVGILDSPMMGYLDADNQLSGFEAELAQQICERIDYQCEFILQPFGLNLEGVRQGHLDLAFSSILVTDARKKYLTFSERYMRSVSIYVGNPKKQPKYRPTKVGVVKDSVQEFYLQQNFSHSMETLTYTNVDEAYAALKSGETDRVLLPAIIQLGFLYDDRSGLFDLIEGPIDNPKLTGDVAIAITPERPELKTGIDQAIRSLLTDGSYNHLNNKYFPFNIY